MLRQGLPPAASVLNPIDLLGDAGVDRYTLALRAVAADPNVGGILVILTPQVMTEIEATARVIGELARDLDKPVLACFMGRGQVEPGIQILNRYRVPNYPVPERAVAALAAMMQYRRWCENPPLNVETWDVDRERVQAVFDRARAEGRVTIGDAEAREILAAYGFPTPRTALARDADQAARMAGEIGFPVALKIASPDILHKTDVGGVRLNLTTADEVREAYDLMIYRAMRYVPGADIWGCLVQEMIVGGKEIIVGMGRDPHFGPLMVFGLGGIYVEAVQDVAFRLAPFDRREAQEMINEIKCINLLRGVRGERPSDLQALAESLLRFSQLVTDFPEIVEFDVNPLTLFEEGRGVMGIDMRLILE
jgi:acetyltransferase